MYFQFLLNRQIVEKIKSITALFLVAALLFASAPVAIVFAEDGEGAGSNVEQTQEQNNEPVTTEEETVVSDADQGEQDVSEQQEEVETYTVIETGDAAVLSDVENTVNTNVSSIENTDTQGNNTEDGVGDDTGTDTDTDTANNENDTCTDCNISTVNATSTFDEFTSSNESGETSGETEYGTTTTSETDNSSSTTTSETSEEYGTGAMVSSTSSTSTSLVTSEDTSGEMVSGGEITIVEATNEAEAENTVDAGVQTGGNDASGNDNSLIVTGDAYASANVVNMVNTNIVNSEGFVMLLDSFSGSMDMRDLAFWDLLDESTDEVSDNSCDFGECDNASLFVSSENDATITNNITVSASTGNNTANDGLNAGIVTGNAYASANVVNLANTNIVNSNYLLITANNFGDLEGDLLLPSAGELSQLFFSGTNAVSSIAVANDNEAVVENNVEVGADTGGNEANNCQGSFVMTGDASSGANVVNQINQNFTDTNSFFFLVRVHGNWAGSVYGAPEELTWTETSNGIAIYNDLSMDSASTGSDDPLFVQNSNTAAITNNVSVYALTGENHTNNNENAAIVTGNANAGANIINVANTNVIGQNWMLAVINIFGDWNGNISFGQPDLWIGGQVDTGGKSVVKVNNSAKYHYTIVNNSDTIATGVRVVDQLAQHMYFVESQSGAMLEGRNVVWEIGSLGAGESAEVEYTARVRGSLPVAHTLLENTVTVTSGGTDANMADNTDVLSILGYRRPPYLSSWTDVSTSPDPVSTGSASDLTPAPVLSVSKTNNATTTLFAGATVDYTIVVRNDGGEAYNAVLFDSLKDGEDKVIYEQYWPLETIYPDEEITIEYSIEYDKYTAPGLYTNHAQVEAIAGDPSLDPVIGTFISSSVATSSVTIATSTPPVSGFEIGLATPIKKVTINDKDEEEDSLLTLKVPLVSDPNKEDGNLGLMSFLKGLTTCGLFTPVPVFSQEVQKDKTNSVITGTLYLLEGNLGGFAFIGSSASGIFAPKNSNGLASENDPLGQFASIFDSFIRIWTLSDSWFYLLVLLGFTLILLVRTRISIHS